MPAAVLSARDDVLNLAGPLLLGHLFNICCYGVLSSQVYLYYLAFPRDRRLVKSVVYSLYALETLQTALLILSAYRAFAQHFGDVEILSTAYIDGFTIPILSGIISGIVQMFYARRVSILSGSKPLGLVIVVLAVMQVAAAIVVGVRLSMVQTVDDFVHFAPWSSAIWSGGSALCDTLIATCTTWLLLHADVQFPATKAMISRLIRIVVETGTLTATVAIANLVLFFAFPRAGYYSCGVLVIAKLYSTSLLVLLNSRMRIAGARAAYVAPDAWVAADGAPPARIGPFTSAAQIGPVAVCELPPLALGFGEDESVGESPISQKKHNDLLASSSRHDLAILA
ncbi:hypothetical protein PsYK624_125600 [Phanerochaete sordida]|uniref:DUF6534 domain-containing protein n=1 Tax=Phanerochaete sordida TaxID=48140 RepID=A0A9P3GJL9_9APHY|nr:hypothetical protein PsYK624_125600 [Phanerochaete sordida]